MSTGSVEVVYRGIFQKTLAKNICRGIVFAAKKEGKIGIAFGRYSDSPERNGIPAKQFAVVADTEEEMPEHLSRYEPDNNDVTIAADDTLCTRPHRKEGPNACLHAKNTSCETPRFPIRRVPPDAGATVILDGTIKGPQVRGLRARSRGWAPSSVSAVIALLAPNREPKQLLGEV